jgi:hypothetical protein
LDEEVSHRIMVRRKLIVLVLIINVLVFTRAYGQDISFGAEATKPETESNFFKISEIKRGNFGPGQYSTEGFVVRVYTCPDCPAGAVCKPCMKDNIVISENNQELKDYSGLTNSELIIFTNHVTEFEIGSSYKFLINITNNKSTLENINDIELVSFSEIVDRKVGHKDTRTQSHKNAILNTHYAIRNTFSEQ